MQKVLFISMALSGCVSAGLEKTEPKDPNVKTIGFYTGTLTDDGLYRPQFVGGAEKACPTGYELTERSRTPSTLAGMELPETKFYWVIRCKSH